MAKGIDETAADGVDADILTALAESSRPIPRPEVARRSGWSGGECLDAIARMKALGWLESVDGGYVITDAGRGALADE